MIGWLARGIGAALLLGGIEAGWVVAYTPEAAGDLGLTLGLFLRASGALLLPMMALAALVGAGAKLWRRLPSPAVHVNLGVLVAAAIGAFGARTIDRVFAGLELEFRDELARAMDLAVLLWMLCAAGVGVGVGHLLRSRRLPTPTTVLGIEALALLVYVEWVLHFGLVPVHAERLSAALAIAGIGLAVVAIGLLAHCVPRRQAVVAGVVGAWIIVGATLGPGDSPGTRYLAFARLQAPSIFMRAARDVLDGDDDGAAPIWAGGTDCDDGDPARSPFRREVPGDGIDQDCSGGDAAAPAPTVRRPGPWTACAAALDARPSVLWVTLDAVRADAFDPSLPWIADLARDALWFEHAIAPSTHTDASLPALLAGLAPSDLGGADLFARGGRLQSVTTIAGALRQAGWRTGLFTTLDRTLIQRGFEYAGAGVLDPAPAGGAKAGFTAAALSEQARRWLAAVPGRFFLWVHFLDPHAPYVPIRRDAFARPEGSDYERGVAYSAMQAHRLIRLAQNQTEGPLLVVLTSDHGEDLGARGRQGHGPDVYQGSVRVPLALWLTGCPAARIAPAVSVIDVTPTVAEVAGLLEPKWSLLDGGPRPTPVVSEVYKLGQFRRVVVDQGHALHVDVRNGGRLLFDLRRDPGETDDVYGGPATAALEAAYQRWLDRPSP